MIFHQNVHGKAINFKEHQWNSMKRIQMSPNMDQNRWTPLKTMKSLDVLLKTPWFSSPCEWFRFAFQRNLKSFKMTPWPRLPPKVHLRRKVKYWKCHFLSALHFPEIESSRFETCRLCRFFSNPWVPIKKVMKINGHRSKIDQSLWINENQRTSRKFLIPKQFISHRL